MFPLCRGTDSRFFLSAPIAGTEQLWTLNTICRFQGSQTSNYPRCPPDVDVQFGRHLSRRATISDRSLKTLLSDNNGIQTNLICANVCVCVIHLRCCSVQPLPPPAHQTLRPLEGRERCQCLRGQLLEQLSDGGSLLTFPF